MFTCTINNRHIKKLVNLEIHKATPWGKGSYNYSQYDIVKLYFVDHRSITCFSAKARIFLLFELRTLLL